MAVMDAAIFEALWRHTAKLNMQQPNHNGFSSFFLLQIFISMFYSSDKQSFSPE